MVDSPAGAHLQSAPNGRGGLPRRGRRPAQESIGFRARIITLFDMLSFNPEWFVSLVGVWARLHALHAEVMATASSLGDGDAAAQVRAPAHYRDLIRSGAGNRSVFEWAGLGVTLASYDRLVEAVDDPELTLRDLAALAETLVVVLMDELKLCSFWQVPREYQQFLKPQVFGPEVAKAFPKAADDIEEAGTCLAFGRGTACVFHLMRIIERGLRMLADMLSDPNIDPRRNPSWDSILKKFESEQRKPIIERAPEWRADDAFFSEVHATLRAIKDGWRNPSLHIERDYKPDQAQEIFVAVRSFMRKLATKISESSE